MAAQIVSDRPHRPDAPTRGGLARRPGEGLEAATARLLTEGGDARIVAGPGGVNAYGCSPWPDAGLVPLGSSTASSPSEAGFQAALALHAYLRAAPARIDDELQRLRRDLLRLSGADQVPGTELVLAASGTDLHLIVAHAAAAAAALPRAPPRLQAAPRVAGAHPRRRRRAGGTPDRTVGAGPAPGHHRDAAERPVRTHPPCRHPQRVRPRQRLLAAGERAGAAAGGAVAAGRGRRRGSGRGACGRAAGRLRVLAPAAAGAARHRRADEPGAQRQRRQPPLKDPG